VRCGDRHAPRREYLRITLAYLLVAPWLASVLLACSAVAAEQVVVYTSVDQVFAEPVLQYFQQATGIEVKAVYDAEAAKTVGLERRILAERTRPRADVFWNSEYLRTMRLAATGALARSTPAAARDLPSAYRGPEDMWTGFGGRARVLLVNRDQVRSDQMPAHLSDLVDPRWQGKIAIARPYFGTTATHFAALYLRWGEPRFIAFLKQLKANRAALLPGNSDVRDAVAAGRFAIGLTDTDDAAGAVRAGKPVEVVFPDQDGDGAFEVFHTVALIAGGPNPGSGRRLIDYLASERVERELLRSGAVQIPAHRSLESLAPAAGARRWSLTEPGLLEAIQQSARLVRVYLE
jgi:iron(III) transport system substrate-binding protein